MEDWWDEEWIEDWWDADGLSRPDVIRGRYRSSIFGMTNTFCRGTKDSNLISVMITNQVLFLIILNVFGWWTDLKLALQFLLDPLSDMSKRDLSLPECGAHVKV